jgi:hypothetical protein
VRAGFTLHVERAIAFAGSTAEPGCASRLGRTSRGRSWAGSLVLFVLAVVCCPWPVSALAIGHATCTVGSDPYHASPIALQACGIRFLPLRASRRLPDGGTQLDYVGANGTLSFTVPPSSFDAAKASLSERQIYGIPPEPPASSPEYAQWKEMMQRGIHFVTPPAALAAVPPKHEVPSQSRVALSNGATTLTPLSGATGSSNNWSGYFDWNGHGGYTHTAGYFVEPSDHGSCNTSSAYTWAGIGGWYNPNLGQDGTAQQVPGLGNDQAWTEILPELPIATNLYATPGHWFLADTQYTGSGHYSFYMYNYANGQATHATGSGGFDGNVAEYIVERPGTQNLLNFSRVSFQGFTNGQAFGRYPTERVNMWNGTGELNAGPGAILSQYAFTDYYHHCAGSGGGGSAGEGEGVPPAAETSAASEVTQTEAKLNGTVNPESVDAKYHFEYGTEAENYSFSTIEADAGTGSSPVVVSSVIAGLQPGTTYHYRIIANSPNGITAGADATLTTSGSPPPPPPTVTTEGASGLGHCSATLEATVNPNGLDAHYYFEYGTTITLYENFAPSPPGNDAGSGSVPARVSVGLTALALYTKYYYRVVASNSTGTSYGGGREFTTLFSPPVYSSKLGSGQLTDPRYDALDASGNIWVVSAGENHVKEFSASGTLIRTIGSTGSGNGQFNYPVGITINKSAGNLYVSDTGNHRVEEFSVSEGKFIRGFATPGSVHGLAIDSSGNLWVTDYQHVEKYSSTGTLIASYGTQGQFNLLEGIAIDSANHVYVADWGNNRIDELSSEGASIGQFGEKGTGNGQFEGPFGIAIDARSGNIFVTDARDQRSQVFSSSGTFLGKFAGSFGSGEGQFNGPRGITIDSSGNAYIVDGNNGRVQKWVPGGC